MDDVTTELDLRWLEDYRTKAGLVDEMVDVTGNIRSDWAHVGHALSGMGTGELLRRQHDVDRLLEADGASFRRSATGRAEPWPLDAVPRVVSSAEWAIIESGVTQRATLLDLLLADIYGPRQLLERRIIPPELVLGDPEFLRARHGMRPPQDVELVTYAADLARDDEGELRVLADFAQAPSGAGYAAENRLVMSRVFPSLYRNAQVHRISSYFRHLRAGLRSLGKETSDDPTVVILTPGNWSETAFEHGYLASQLGFTLVEGSELVVRDGKVMLRALGRLQQVDVVLRRLDATYCDPLELDPTSRLGVPGLVEATRRGTVAVVNPLGAAVIENPALQAFMPEVARTLLGQELELRGTDTWWCGNPEGLARVRAEFDSLVIIPIDRNKVRSIGPRSVSRLTADQRTSLMAEIEASPRDWVGRYEVQFSTAPTLTPDGVEPRRSVLRTFAVNHDSSIWLMPGGLTRTAPPEAEALLSLQHGAVSKDTWVLSSEPQQDAEIILTSTVASATVDPLAGLSQRAVENLFWVGRYAERAEAVARLLRAIDDRRNKAGLGDPSGDEAVQRLLGALTTVTFTQPGFTGPSGAALMANPSGELWSLTCDTSRPGSLAHAVSLLLSAAEAVRDQLSLDTWQVTSALERQLFALARAEPGRQDVVQGTLGGVMHSLLALHGLAGESMVRDAGWYFLEAGRRLERFQQLARLLSATLSQDSGTPADSIVLESLLVAAESSVTYRRRYRSEASAEALLDLLVVDPGNPRSLRFQAERLEEAIGGIPGERSPGMPTPEERSVIRLSAAVRLAETPLLAATEDDLSRPNLHEFIAELVGLADDAANALADSSFAKLLPLRPLSGVRPDEVA